MTSPLQAIKDRFVSLDNFIHGGWSENPSYHQDRWERSRIAFAAQNPWVLSYHFGHKQLIDKHSSTPTII